MAKKKQQAKAPEAKKEFSSLPKSYIDRLNRAIENRKQRKDAANAAKANAKASQGLEGQEG